MWQRSVNTGLKKAPGILLVLFPVLFIPQFSFSQNGKSHIFFLDVETRDTLDSQEIDESSTVIGFKSNKLKHKYDVVLLKKQNEAGSLILNVPAKKGATNLYRLVSGNSYFSFSLQDEKLPLFLSFGGNDYLDAYQQLVAKDPLTETPPESEREKYLNLFVHRYIDFEARFPNAQIIGYHLLYAKPDLEKKFPDNEANQLIAKLLKGKTGFYYERIKQQDRNRENRNCITNKPDSLIFQSAKSQMEIDPNERNVHVLIFWATWCGPCKATLQQMNELNKTHYAGSPVYFDAVSSEEDLIKVYRYYNEHPEFFSSLGFFNDSEQCMQSNYGITKLPTVLIFDKDKKLMATDPEPENIKQFIDQLLAKP